jgi:hypothetical protein
MCGPDFSSATRLFILSERAMKCNRKNNAEKAGDDGPCSSGAT